MTRFIISETLVNYFVVDAENEDEAFDKVSYRSPKVTKPNHIDVIGYNLVEDNSIEGYGVLGTLDNQEAL